MLHGLHCPWQMIPCWQSDWGEGESLIFQLTLCVRETAKRERERPMHAEETGGEEEEKRETVAFITAALVFLLAVLCVHRSLIIMWGRESLKQRGWTLGQLSKKLLLLNLSLIEWSCVSLTHCEEGLHWRRPLLRQLKVALTIQLFCVYCATRGRPLAIVCNSLSPSLSLAFFLVLSICVCVCQVTKSTRTNPRLISVLSLHAKSNVLQPLSCGDSCVSKDPLDTGIQREREREGKEKRQVHLEKRKSGHL